MGVGHMVLGTRRAMPVTRLLLARAGISTTRKIIKGTCMSHAHYIFLRPCCRGRAGLMHCSKRNSACK
jgi:hypothetical protein